MKTLYLLRHATPTGGEPGQRDQDRPLAAEAAREAAAVARRLDESPGAQPVRLALCSSARRTVETLEAIRGGLPADVAVLREKELYCASQGELLTRISRVEDAVEGILLIGHNPGIAVLAATLAQAGDPELVAQLQVRYPPAALAVIDFDVTRWSDVSGAGGRLVDFSV